MTKGWHQSAIDRARESLQTIKADREATQAMAAMHLASLAVPQPTDGKGVDHEESIT